MLAVNRLSFLAEICMLSFIFYAFRPLDMGEFLWFYRDLNQLFLLLGIIQSCMIKWFGYDLLIRLIKTL